jgi:hypothetical protein
MRALLFLVVLGTAVARAAAAPAEPFAFIAFGCMPYGGQAWPGFERMIDEINRQRPAFAVHCGDIKSGAEAPTDEHYERILRSFNRVDGALIYTPGDNEWTDVHRGSNGGADPALWLDKIRSLFFAREQSLGRTPLPLVTQRRNPRYSAFLENARWTVGGVVFATVHVIGSNNNDQPEIPGAVEEFRRRDEANAAWIRETFFEAWKAKAPGIALFFQANPFVEDYGKPGRGSGYRNFLDALEEVCLRFERPVLLVHADEHRFRLDRGHRFDRNATPVPNVTRLETFGEDDQHGVIVVVDPASPQVFLPAPMIVPGNPLPRLPRGRYEP